MIRARLPCSLHFPDLSLRTKVSIIQHIFFSRSHEFTNRLLHLCEVVRPGKYFVRRMLNLVGLPPARAWSAKYHASHTRAASSPRIHLGPEFHADASFWRLLVEGGLGSPAGRLSAPLYRSFMQPPTFTLWSDASGDAMGGYFLGPGPGSSVWWRFEFGDDVRARLRATVKDWNDLSINVLELLGMVVTAWIFVTQSDARPCLLYTSPSPRD